MSRMGVDGDIYVGYSDDRRKRVEIRVDPYAPEPDQCQQLPVYRLERGRFLERLNEVELHHHRLDGCDYSLVDGTRHYLEDAYEHVKNSTAGGDVDHLTTLQRWLRIFHQGDLAWISDHSTGNEYVTYSTAAGDAEWQLRPLNGCHDWSDLKEWYGWHMGDCYNVSLQERGDEGEWVEYDVSWTFYDLDAALAEAESQLEN